MNKKILITIGILCLIGLIALSLIGFKKPEKSTGIYHLDVIDLRDKDEKTRLLALSLQGIVNRDSPKIYLLWESKDKFGNPSEAWLEYYKSKGWISYEYVSLPTAIKKHADKINGFVIYDPNFRHSINIATTMAGLNNTLIAHLDFVPELKQLGFSVKADLRGKWKDKYEAYEWQLENLFPKCNKDMIASAMPVEDPRTHKANYNMQRPIRDYVIMHRMATIDLIPHNQTPKDYQLLEKYYQQMNPYAKVVGYPVAPRLERSHVELASKHRLLVVLAHSTSVDFSVHSQMPAETIYKQDHKTSFSFDPNKIYIAFVMSDLGLNSMQDRYYGAWDDPKRGNLPLNWWLDGVVKDFCPGIVQYYYETKTPNDYFHGAHVGGRIRPSDFPDLEEYLKRNKKYLEDCDLRTVGFSNHGKKDDYVFEIYSKVLDNCIGFFYGWSPEFELGQSAAGNVWLFHDKVWIITATTARPNRDVDGTVKEISSFIEKNEERPLFMTVLVILGDYPTVDFLEKVKEKTDLLYPGQIEWVRGDELILVAEKQAKGK